MFTNQDSGMNQFLLLIKAIALFSADQHEEAMLLIKELAAACPNADPLARRVVETYLRVQLGIKALDGSHYDEATDYFTAAITSGAFSSKYIHQIYEDLIMLFGWDLESLCFTAHQKRCQAFLSAGKPDEALEAHKYVMDAMDESAKANCLDWSNRKFSVTSSEAIILTRFHPEFKEQCSVLVEQNDRILGAEIPGQEQDGYDTEPNFFDGMHQYSQVSQPRPQQHPWRLKRLRFRITRAPRPAPLTAPTIPPPVTTATTFRAHIRHLFTWSPHRARLPVVDVPFAQGKERNAAADEDRSKDPNIVPDDECLDTTQQDPNTQQQQQPAPDDDDAAGGKSHCTNPFGKTPDVRNDIDPYIDNHLYIAQNHDQEMSRQQEENQRRQEIKHELQRRELELRQGGSASAITPSGGDGFRAEARRRKEEEAQLKTKAENECTRVEIEQRQLEEFDILQ
ncbi:hypothetical protein BDR04DRAFT_1149927 [Suillus decipiens]|nr:hypothetical protein BDR04DRAFT_1149927 [Suillus decipiens]